MFILSACTQLLQLNRTYCALQMTRSHQPHPAYTIITKRGGGARIQAQGYKREDERSDFTNSNIAVAQKEQDFGVEQNIAYG